MSTKLVKLLKATIVAPEPVCTTQKLCVGSGGFDDDDTGPDPFDDDAPPIPIGGCPPGSTRTYLCADLDEFVESETPRCRWVCVSNS